VPLIAVPLDLPPHVVELRAGDVDGDGISELIAVERKKNGARPDTVALSAHWFDQSGAVQNQWRVDLKNQPLMIDIEHGIWAVGGNGVVSISQSGVEPAVTVPSPLANLGPTTPVFADLLDDLEGDGVPEAVVASGSRLRIVSVTGEERLNVSARSRGELEVRMRGGTQVVSAAVSPTWQLDDFNGDGFRDLLLASGKRLTVHPMTPEGAAPVRTVSLPIDVTPRRRDGTEKKNETRKRVVSVWFQDLDGDNRTDFAAQLWVTEGSWMGAEGELVFAKGTGQGFGPLQRMRSDSAVLLVRLIDIDGDGDTEFVSAEVDFGVGNLTRAMLTQKIKVDVLYRKMTNGRYSEARSLHSVVVPVGNDRDPSVELEHDLTGDGIPDLVTSQGTEAVQLFRGTGSGFTDSPTASIDVGFNQDHHKLWVGDLTGDGRAEVVMWRKKHASATLLLHRP
jgi:hypothetical protein